MKTLCIDVGNTSTHFGVVDARQVSAMGDFPTAELLKEPSREFYQILTPLFTEVTGIAFCSVVPGVNANLEASLTQAQKPIFQLTHHSCKGLNLAYPKPEEIGQDRIANAMAAQEYYGTPAVVIDMGTAVTFDIITSKGYEGGIIAPGLAVMRHYLHEQTALLPELTEDELIGVKGGIGKSTVQAMQLGVAVGFSGMIDALLKRVQDELRSQGEQSPVVLSTGGSIANLTRDWLKKSEFVENLTLLGLAVAAERELN